MKRDCNLELRLVPPPPPPPSCFSDDNYHRQGEPIEEILKPSGKVDSEEKRNQLTIFYNGSVRVCDVTELQARAIMMVASQGMEEKWRRGSEPLTSPLLPSPSMKTSLERFLQKRKHRIQSTSPYHR